jgi:hypothetical protein
LTSGNGANVPEFGAHSGKSLQESANGSGKLKWRPLFLNNARGTYFLRELESAALLQMQYAGSKKACVQVHLKCKCPEDQSVCVCVCVSEEEMAGKVGLFQAAGMIYKSRYR